MNILFLMADQIHARALSAYGGRHIHTPHLDRLAAQGAAFDNAYCAWPVCSPSRASIFTGQYAHTHGITRNVDDPSLPSITNDTVFTENILASRGFTTHYIGRWHTGPRETLDCFRGRTETRTRSDYHTTALPAEIQKLRQVQPVIPLKSRGGGDAGTRLVQQTVHMTPEVWEAHQRWQASENAVFPILSLIGRSIIPPQHQPEAVFADEIIARLRDNGGRPFMMTWSVNAPHDPVVTPEPYYSLVPRTDALLPPNHNDDPGPLGSVSRDLVRTVGKEAVLEHIAVYLGMVKFVDDQIGRMLATLDELGLADQTLVLFTGDHGDMLGGHGMVYKSTQGFYEETTKVPLIVRCPGRIPAGRRIAAPVSLIDLAPTLLDHADCPPPATMQGMSLRPLLEGRTEDAPHTVMCQRHGGRMVRAGDWKYGWYAGGRQWLFNLADDSGETHNLMGDPAHARMLDHLRDLLRREMDRTQDPMIATVFPTAVSNPA